MRYFSLLLLCTLLGCSAHSRVSTDAAVDAQGIDGAVVDASPSPTDVVSLSIEPPATVLTSTDGSRETVSFQALAHLRDGTTVPATGVEWSRDATDVGDIDAVTGLFTSTGFAGGVADVHARVASAAGGTSITAAATVEVTIVGTVMVAGVPADAATHFVTPALTDLTRAANILYPLDGAVMPQNVAPAEIQWERGVANDIFRITLTKPHATITAYARADSTPRNAWLVEASSWRSIAVSDPDSVANIAVDRFVLATGDVVASPAVHVRFARGVVLGSIYYWDLGAGESIRIDDGTGERTHFMPNPPGASATGHGCIGCHAISHDGRYLSAETGSFQGAVFDLTTDLTGMPAPAVYPLETAPAWYWSSFSPDSKRIVADKGYLGLYDPLTGSSIAPREGTLPSSHASQPVWSPDGTAIAYAANISSGEGNTDFNSADIGIVPVIGEDAFGASFILHTGSTLATATPPGNSDNYPTWSPDSLWIAFAHGDGYRGDTDHDALFLISRSGGEATRLDNACAGVTTTNNYIPSFSPFDTGGYYWITFQSTRDYGNAVAGTRGTHRPQVWVAAVSHSPTPGVDPSEVAFWLPGQDVASQNIEASWAPRACRQNGDECNVSSECCSNECRDNGAGVLECGTPPPERCHEYGETCSSNDDCCAGDNLVCQGNVCLNVLL